MRFVRSLTSTGLLVAILATTARAAARDESDVSVGETIALVWSAPRECPTVEELRARVLSCLPAGADVRARGAVERTSRRYRLRLEIEAAAGNGARGERVLEAASCDELASAAAAVLAMSQASVAVTPASPPALASTSPPASANAPLPEPPPIVSTPVRTPASAPDAAEVSPERPPLRASSRSKMAENWRVSARVQGIVDAGTLPVASAGGGIAVGVAPTPNLLLEVAGNAWIAQDGRLDGDTSRGATFELYAASARGCITVARPASIALAPCVGVEVARLAATGFGAVKVADVTAVTWAPEGAVLASVPLVGPVSARVGLGAAIPIARRSFVITSSGTVHTPAAVALRAWFGPEVRF